MNSYDINLNIHWTTPDYLWHKIAVLYSEMPGWRGFVDNGCPKWFGEDGKLIWASVEPSGLQIYAELPDDEWNEWISLFKRKASKILGYEVGEPEDGFEFKYYD